MLKGIEIRLYPNKTQSDYINRLLGSYRKVYNMCLQKKIDVYNNNKENFSLKEMGQYFHQELTKSEEFSYLNEHNTKVLKQSIIDLLDSYKRFFVNKTGFPNFKSKKDKTSCRFPLEAMSKYNIFSDSKITLGKNLQQVSFNCSDRDKKYLTVNKDKIKSATLTRTKSDKYFLSILIENIVEPIQKPINEIIGLDMGIKTFITGSNGTSYDNLNLHKNSEKKIKKLQKQLSKKVKGSRNRYKTKIKLAKVYEKINNKKQNYIHNITTQLIRENQTIVIEDLNVKGMLKNHKLAKSISDLSIHEVFRQLKYKSEWYNRNLVVIDKWFPSSKKCSKCGYIYKGLTLNQRSWICPTCGQSHDRDANASMNIELEGKRILGIRCPEFTLVDYPPMDDLNRNVVLKSSGRKKQEEKC